MYRDKMNTEEQNVYIQESTVGYEENRELRRQLDALHEEYNRLIDIKNKEYTENFRQAPRISGYGNRRIISSKENYVESQIKSSVVNQPPQTRNSYYLAQNTS